MGDAAMEKERTCLKCDKKFLSEGSGNRICKVCKLKDRNICIPKLKTSKVMRAREVAPRE